jgi:hypothetical protein
MKKELDEYLCKTYPRMMVNRNKGMQETCMCWGFECGDGWFTLLDQLMGNIQNHIDWKIKQRAWAMEYNEMATQCKAGNFELFEKSMETVTNPEYKEKRLKEIVEGEFRVLPEVVWQVTLDQVKEKFGTLRFYYTGGDEYISGLVSMAESMSGVICEECGNPATTESPKNEDGTIGGWIRTECKPCADKRAEDLKKYNEEWEMRKLLKEGNEQ